MTISKKKRRTIRVDNELYHWIVRVVIESSKQDLYIEPITLNLIVRHLDNPTKKILAPIPATGTFGLLGSYSQSLAIPPKAVRRVIEYALDSGWNPKFAKQDLILSPEIARSFIENRE